MTCVSGGSRGPLAPRPVSCSFFRGTTTRYKTAINWNVERDGGFWFDWFLNSETLFIIILLLLIILFHQVEELDRMVTEMASFKK